MEIHSKFSLKRKSQQKSSSFTWAGTSLCFRCSEWLWHVSVRTGGARGVRQARALSIGVLKPAASRWGMSCKSLGMPSPPTWFSARPQLPLLAEEGEGRAKRSGWEVWLTERQRRLGFSEWRTRLWIALDQGRSEVTCVVHWTKVQECHGQNKYYYKYTYNLSKLRFCHLKWYKCMSFW